jgi:hypothetical protein
MRSRALTVVAAIAFVSMVAYNWAVQLFDAPVPPSPWGYVLAVAWTALFLPWLAFLGWRAWQERRATPDGA